MNTLTAAAETWLNSGIAVIPVAWRDKRPAVSAWREFQTRLPTSDEVRRWFQSRLTNLAVITGWRGLTVLDFDQRAAYDLWRDWSREAAPAARFSYTVQTSRGVHVYLFIDEPVPTMRAGNIDVKAAGGYVLAPPSIHPSGTPYRLLSDAPILRVDRLARVLPASLLALAQPTAPVAPPHAARVAQLPADPWAAAADPVRLADDAIADRLARHNILELFHGAIRRGDRWWACCPLHNDRHPSVSIDTDGRRARCWAGCLWGDYADWYAAINHITLQEALQEL
ncbi:MAG TPA: bifunctional DNA primase/polymerase [Promineifilum sp.]|nr:bifunctional DNA primase/polymerase [Promineifilum sp.]